MGLGAKRQKNGAGVLMVSGCSRVQPVPAPAVQKQFVDCVLKANKEK